MNCGMGLLLPESRPQTMERYAVRKIWEALGAKPISHKLLPQNGSKAAMYCETISIGDLQVIVF